MKTPIKIYLPIACDQLLLGFNLSSENATNSILDKTPGMLDDIVSSSQEGKIELDFDIIGKSTLLVEKIDDLPDFVATVVDRSFPFARILKEKWYCFSVDIEYTTDKEIKENSIYAKYGFKSSINQFLMLTDICRLGTARFDEGLIETPEGQLEHFTPCRSGIVCEVFSYIYSNGLLNFCDLNISSSWSFLSNNGFEKGLSKTPLTRAINCLSRIYRSNGDLVEHLFWAVMGLEAVYVRGYGVGKQLSEKCAVFLGLKNDTEKNINKMYELRSRFIHGDRDLRSVFTGIRTLEDYQESDREEYLTTLFAIGLLISTIQKMIVEQRTQLDFQYVLV